MWWEFGLIQTKDFHTTCSGGSRIICIRRVCASGAAPSLQRPDGLMHDGPPVGGLPLSRLGFPLFMCLIFQLMALSNLDIQGMNPTWCEGL